MWKRRWSGVSDYVWFINQDVMPQLDQLYLTSTLAVPPNFLAYGPDGVMRMKGKPVIEVEYAQTMGTEGDILLAAMSQYQAIDKGGVQTAESIHVAFATDETCYRFVYRIDGQPSWHSALTPLHGSNTQSPFVSLNAATA
jgi:HK97 family phage major capsid protein